MEVTVKFQGIIADMLGCKTARIELTDGATVDDLLATLTGNDDTARSVLKQTRAFIDGQQANRQAQSRACERNDYTIWPAPVFRFLNGL